MVRSPEWDGLSRAEWEEQEAQKALEKAKEKELEDKRMLAELMEKYPDYEWERNDKTSDSNA
jgi:hypothetical protein